jgi:hypothetical protein
LRNTKFQKTFPFVMVHFIPADGLVEKPQTVRVSSKEKPARGIIFQGDLL